MYCPNCGAQNKKKQNYCRYCGLHLHNVEKSYLNQLVFGEDTSRMKTFRSVKNFVDYTEILLIVSVVVMFLTLYFSGYPIRTRFLPIGIGIVFLFDILRQIVRYFERKSLRENNKRENLIDQKQNEFETKETQNLIEDKPFIPISSVTENSTELLFVDRKSNSSE